VYLRNYYTQFYLFFVGTSMQRRILPGIDLSYPQALIKNKDVFPYITGARNKVFQGNLSMDLRAVDQTQMYPFLK
jgi:hypothetical protein